MGLGTSNKITTIVCWF